MIVEGVKDSDMLTFGILGDEDSVVRVLTETVVFGCVVLVAVFEEIV